MAQIEIGRGKSARRGFTLDDVSIVPTRRTRDDDDVNLGWQLDAFAFDVPLIGIDYGPNSGEMASFGGLSAIDAAQFVNDAGEFDADAIKSRITELNEAGATTSVSVRPQRAEEFLAALGKTEIDLLLVRGRVVSAEHVSSSREPLNLKKTVRHIEVPVIVGNCSSYKAALHLMRTGAAAVVVGSDPASHGVGVPLATAIADVRAARMAHLDETGVYVNLIASTPVRTGGDIAKAIVCGADAVLVERTDDDLSTIIGQLRRTMATCGFESLKEFQSAELVVSP